VTHDDETRVARQPLGRSSWNARAVLEVQGGLGEERERVSLLLLHRRRIGLRRVSCSALIQRFPRCRQRLHEQSPGLRRQPSPDPHRAILVGVDVQHPGVLAGCLTRLRLEIHPPPAAHQPGNVFGRTGAAGGEQTLLRLRRRHASQLADL
jgi:hypothetical protein